MSSEPTTIMEGQGAVASSSSMLPSNSSTMPMLYNGFKTVPCNRPPIKPLPRKPQFLPLRVNHNLPNQANSSGSQTIIQAQTSEGVVMPSSTTPRPSSSTPPTPFYAHAQAQGYTPQRVITPFPNHAQIPPGASMTPPRRVAPVLVAPHPRPVYYYPDTGTVSRPVSVSRPQLRPPPVQSRVRPRPQPQPHQHPHLHSHPHPYAHAYAERYYPHLSPHGSSGRHRPSPPSPLRLLFPQSQPPTRTPYPHLPGLPSSHSPNHANPNSNPNQTPSSSRSPQGNNPSLSLSSAEANPNTPSRPSSNPSSSLAQENHSPLFCFDQTFSRIVHDLSSLSSLRSKYSAMMLLHQKERRERVIESREREREMEALRVELDEMRARAKAVQEKQKQNQEKEKRAKGMEMEMGMRGLKRHRSEGDAMDMDGADEYDVQKDVNAKRRHLPTPPSSVEEGEDHDHDHRDTVYPQPSTSMIREFDSESQLGASGLDQYPSHPHYSLQNDHHPHFPYTSPPPLHISKSQMLHGRRLLFNSDSTAHATTSGPSNSNAAKPSINPHSIYALSSPIHLDFNSSNSNADISTVRVGTTRPNPIGFDIQALSHDPDNHNYSEYLHRSNRGNRTGPKRRVCDGDGDGDERTRSGLDLDLGLESESESKSSRPSSSLSSSSRPGASISREVEIVEVDKPMSMPEPDPIPDDWEGTTFSGPSPLLSRLPIDGASAAAGAGTSIVIATANDVDVDDVEIDAVVDQMDEGLWECDMDLEFDSECESESGREPASGEREGEGAAEEGEVSDCESVESVEVPLYDVLRRRRLIKLREKMEVKTSTRNGSSERGIEAGGGKKDVLKNLRRSRHIDVVDIWGMSIKTPARSPVSNTTATTACRSPHPLAHHSVNSIQPSPSSSLSRSSSQLSLSSSSSSSSSSRILQDKDRNTAFTTTCTPFPSGSSSESRKQKTDLCATESMKLKLSDLGQMFVQDDEEGKIYCRYCPRSTLKKTGSKLFTVDAKAPLSLDNLVEHCAREHPTVYSEVSGLTVEQVGEVGRRLEREMGSVSSSC